MVRPVVLRRGAASPRVDAEVVVVAPAEKNGLRPVARLKLKPARRNRRRATARYRRP
jgi:hypothetical protein